jgi:hypothetical protein
LAATLGIAMAIGAIAVCFGGVLFIVGLFKWLFGLMTGESE